MMWALVCGTRDCYITSLWNQRHYQYITLPVEPDITSLWNQFTRGLHANYGPVLVHCIGLPGAKHLKE